MNLVGTLAKVAVGVLVARGVGKMITKNRTGGGSLTGNQPPQSGDRSDGAFGDSPGAHGSGSAQTSSGHAGQSQSGAGDLLEKLNRGMAGQAGSSTAGDIPERSGRGNAGYESSASLEELLAGLQRSGAGQRGSALPDDIRAGGSERQSSGGFGGLGGLLGKVLSGGNRRRRSSPQQGSGGLGDLLESLQRDTVARPQQSSDDGLGGIGGILGKVLSGAGGSGGGLGGILDGLGGGQQQPQGGGSFGNLINDALRGKPQREVEPAQNAQAEILLRGMINAAKSDGRIDHNEQATIFQNLGDVSPEELDFVRKEFAQPLDIHAFIRSVPKGLEQQVYLMSLLGIKLDSRAEAEYLDHLAQGLGISHDVANRIHAQAGAPNLYSRTPG